MRPYTHTVHWVANVRHKAWHCLYLAVVVSSICTYPSTSFMVVPPFPVQRLRLIHPVPFCCPAQFPIFSFLEHSPAKFPFVQYSHTILHTCIDNVHNLYALFVLWDSLLHNTSHYMNLVQQLLALLFVSCSCRYFREPSYFWTKQLKTIVFVAAKHIENEELFLK